MSEKNLEVSDSKELAVLNPVTSTLELIERMATNPAVDADKMGKLVDMQIKIMDKQAEMDFNVALARIKPLLPVIEKNGTIKFTDKNGNDRVTPHARYEDIQQAIAPFLAEEGFSLSFDTEPGAPPLIKCTLSHKGGHSMTKSLPLPLDTSGSKNNLQAMGSTVSYGQRYLVKMMFDLIIKGEDDDGASAPITEEQAAEIKKALEETKSDVKAFLKLMKAESVEKIPSKDFGKAHAQLAAKRQRIEKEKK